MLYMLLLYAYDMTFAEIIGSKQILEPASMLVFLIYIILHICKFV